MLRCEGKNSTQWDISITRGIWIALHIQALYKIDSHYIQIIHTNRLICSSFTPLPAIETTDVIRNTENKQVKRNMSKYFQRMFMLISLSFGYLFYDKYLYFFDKKMLYWPYVVYGGCVSAIGNNRLL